jgi:hypothetical protein
MPTQMPLPMKPLLLLVILLLCLKKKHSNKDILKYLPILVKINIMEDRAKEELERVRKELRAKEELERVRKELRPDVFKQAWLGIFDYTFCGHRIHGLVELTNTQIFSVGENNEWLFNEMCNVKDLILYLSKNRLKEIPGWNSKITCSIVLDNSHLIRDFFIENDILNERHSHNIRWEKKLVA